MMFDPTEDQRAFLDAAARIAARHAATPALPQRVQYSDTLERDLREAGLFEAFGIEELGPVAAAAMVIELAKLPLCAELAASALVAPWLCPQLPGPFALVWGDDAAPTRFLPVARTVVRVRGEAVETTPLAAADVETLESLFAYPMGVLRDPAALPWRPVPGADATRLRNMWRAGIAAETAGALQAALDSVLDHVKQRRQFGRPLGAFQAVQHRLAECATLIDATHWLALRAAGSGSTLDGAMAAAYAQDAAKKVAYDLHQFMGAMGLTLEHPLHRWTYRTKLLRSELGGREHQFAAAAGAAWSMHAPHDEHHAHEGTPQ